MPCTQRCKAGVLLRKAQRGPRVAPNTAVPRHISVRNSCYATALLGKDDVILCIFENGFSCEAYSDGLLCTSDLLEIDLQEKSHETEREKRRALLRGGTRAQMANLVPRDQKREKLARSELKRSVLHCK